jgi:hypothetical protein
MTTGETALIVGGGALALYLVWRLGSANAAPPVATSQPIYPTNSPYPASTLATLNAAAPPTVANIASGAASVPSVSPLRPGALPENYAARMAAAQARLQVASAASSIAAISGGLLPAATPVFTQ